MRDIKNKCKEYAPNDGKFTVEQYEEFISFMAEAVEENISDFEMNLEYAIADAYECAMDELVRAYIV